MTNAAKTINVSLTIQDAPPGTGQTPDRKYNYIFDPDRVHVTEPHTEIVYRLTGDDATRFQMADLYATDAHAQLHGMKVIDDGAAIRVQHKNLHRQLIVVLVTVKDRLKGNDFGCDPQVTNDPMP